ncbi:MAG: flagellar biosynthetic protein FliO [Geminicoccaceae bacterium]
MTALAPELTALGRSLLALAAVVALVLAARRFTSRSAAMRIAGEPLILAASLPLDARNRLVVVRRGTDEFVLAIGAQGVVPLEPARAALVENGDPA